MKVAELFEDISEYFAEILYEMAFSRREVENKISSLSDPLVEHLIKIVKWDDSLNRAKHISDINSWLRQISRLRFKGDKIPKERDYYQWMCIDIIRDEKSIATWIKSLTNYHNLTVLKSDTEVYLELLKILKEVSHDLSKDNLNLIEDYL